MKRKINKNTKVKFYVDTGLMNTGLSSSFQEKTHKLEELGLDPEYEELKRIKKALDSTAKNYLKNFVNYGWCFEDENDKSLILQRIKNTIKRGG